MKKIAWTGCAVICFLLSGCGVDVMIASVFNAGLQAKQAKEAVKQEEEVKKRVHEAIKLSGDKNKKAMDSVQADAGVSPTQSQAAASDVSAAMNAAEDQSK